MHSDLIAVRDALSRAEVHYATVEVRGDRARVLPVLGAPTLYAALSARFDEAWNLHWSVESASPVVVRCRLEFLGHAREGLGGALDLDSARSLALTQAAQAWEVVPPDFPSESVWVEYDPEEGPNLDGLGEDELGAPDQGAQESPPDPQMEKAKRHIDELMDQLRERGLGKQAVLVLTRHGGGYGADLEESRRVYAELKALTRAG